MLNEGLKQLLAGTPAVTALIGTGGVGGSRSRVSNGRDQSSGIFFGTAPKDSVQPFVVYAEVHGDGEMTLDGPDPLQAARIEFSCQANNYKDAKSLARVIRQTLEAFTGALTDGTVIDSMKRASEVDLFEEATSMHSIRVDFQVAYEDLSS